MKWALKGYFCGKINTCKCFHLFFPTNESDKIIPHVPDNSISSALHCQLFLKYVQTAPTVESDKIIPCVPDNSISSTFHCQLLMKYVHSRLLLSIPYELLSVT